MRISATWGLLLMVALPLTSQTAPQVVPPEWEKKMLTPVSDETLQILRNTESALTQFERATDGINLVQLNMEYGTLRELHDSLDKRRERVEKEKNRIAQIQTSKKAAVVHLFKLYDGLMRAVGTATELGMLVALSEDKAIAQNLFEAARSMQKTANELYQELVVQISVKELLLGRLRQAPSSCESDGSSP